MSEHTGIPHDLPAYESNTSPSPIRWRAQIFKGYWGWNWAHQCSAQCVEQGYGYLSWRLALRYACEHMRRHA